MNSTVSADGRAVLRSWLLPLVTFAGMLTANSFEGAPSVFAADEESVVDLPPVEVIRTPIIRFGEGDEAGGAGALLIQSWLASSDLSADEQEALKQQMQQTGKQIDQFNRRALEISGSALGLAADGDRRMILRKGVDKLAVDLAAFNRDCGTNGPKKGSQECVDRALDLNARRRGLIKESMRLRDEILESNKATQELADEVARFVNQSLVPLMRQVYESARVAQVRAASGEVSDIDFSGNRRPLTTDASLSGRMMLETGSTGAIHLLVAGEVDVYASTSARFSFEARLIPIDSFSFEVQEVLHTVRGKFRWVGGQYKKMMNRRFTVRTPTATIGRRGTDMILDVGDDGRTTVTMLEGQAEVTPTGSQTTTLIDAGQSATVDPGGQVRIERDINTRDALQQWSSLPGVRDLVTDAEPDRSNWKSAWRVAIVLVPLVVLAWVLRRRISRVKNRQSS